MRVRAPRFARRDVGAAAYRNLEACSLVATLRILRETPCHVPRRPLCTPRSLAARAAQDGQGERVVRIFLQRARGGTPRGIAIAGAELRVGGASQQRRV